jgi:dGTP triphosphohydrolase
MNHSKKTGIELTRSEIVGLNSVLVNVEYKEPISNIFRKMCTYNVKVLKELEEGYSLSEAFPLLETANEYNSKLKVLDDALKEKILAVESKYEFSNNDDYLNATAETQQSFVDETTELRDASTKEIDILNEEYADVIAEQTGINEDRTAFLAESDTVELITISIDELPQYESVEGVNHWSIWELLDKLTFYTDTE